MIRKIITGLSACVLLFMANTAAVGEVWIIKSGRPQAEIVIGENVPRSVTLAAKELQGSLARISGATLPIVTEPDADVPVKVYVGQSPATESLGISVKGLPNGAYRMVSGENWLALVGYDADFTPPEPYMKNAAEHKRVLAELDELTGEKWEFPYTQIWKEYNRKLNIWEWDQRGSFNAVCGYLYSLGMRWYMPGPLGTITPSQANLPLPKVDKTVSADFVYRYPYIYGKKFGSDDTEDVLWQIRMGFDRAIDGFGLDYLAHGTQRVISRSEIKEAHPEYYALVGGNRLNGEKNYHPCFSSEGVFEQDVKRARFMFDYFNQPVVSVMPTDGYTAICQCEKCSGQAEPERGWTGQFSEHIWNYVQRVAEELYKSHPDRKVIAMAYGSYLQPPRKIKKLSPNIIILIAQHRSGLGKEPDKFTELRAEYEKLASIEGPCLMTYEYYLTARRSSPTRHFPVLFPRSVARDMAQLKGRSFGEFNEVYREYQKPITQDCFSIEHLNLYVTGRCWWDADLDVDELLDEYCRDMYGPASAEMRGFIAYCEENWPYMRRQPQLIDGVFERLEKVLAKLEPESDYAQRLAPVVEYLAPLREIQKELSQGRVNVPEVTLADRGGQTVVMDGKLDDAFWADLPEYSLRDVSTAEEPMHGTSFKIAWADGSLYVGVVCKDSDMENLNITATDYKDTSIWNGDNVEIMLETSAHSYYQMVVNPAGAIMDLDRDGGGFNTNWRSNLEVATARGDDHWSVEIRMPIANALQAEIDPLNGIAGDAPSTESPWHFNVCRQHARGEKTEWTAFSPTIKGGFNVPLKFAKLFK